MGFLIALCLTFANASPPSLENSIEQLTQMDGSKFTTDKNRLLVYFWATWCVNCMEKLRTELPAFSVPEGGQIVTVNTDKDIERARHFIKEEGLKIPVMRDDRKALTSPLKAYAVPFWAVLEREGKGWKVLAAQSGGTTDQMKTALWQ